MAPQQHCLNSRSGSPPTRHATPESTRSTPASPRSTPTRVASAPRSRRSKDPKKQRVAILRQERLDAYADYFANLRREQNTLEELYAPVSARLAEKDSAEQEQDLEFSIRWEADLDAWLERGTTLFDQRTTIPYGTMEGLADAARKSLVPAWVSGDPERVKTAMRDEFLDGFRGAQLAPGKYLRTGITIRDVLQWLYEVDHVKLTYGLKYNGVELEKLSPGTKGIVLLILYIGMDHADTRPLIVDQPDENLDNESIYELLTTYFKTAKGRRQILLITHNPNLVVNTDSEQIIVATAGRRANGLPHIMYRSGPLEENVPGQHSIRQQVCRILEGGSDAFRRREQRYALPDGSPAIAACEPLPRTVCPVNSLSARPSIPRRPAAGQAARLFERGSLSEACRETVARAILPAPFIVRTVPQAGDIASTSWSRGSFSGYSRFPAGEPSGEAQADWQRTKSNLLACTRIRDGRRAVAVW